MPDRGHISKLIKRLRSNTDCPLGSGASKCMKMRLEAADELQAQLLPAGIDLRHLASAHADQEAEIERLRQIVKFDGVEKERLTAIAKAANAEVERLRDLFSKTAGDLWHANEEIERLKPR